MYVIKSVHYITLSAEPKIILSYPTCEGTFIWILTLISYSFTCRRSFCMRACVHSHSRIIEKQRVVVANRWVTQSARNAFRAMKFWRLTLFFRRRRPPQLRSHTHHAFWPHWRAGFTFNTHDTLVSPHTERAAKCIAASHGSRADTCVDNWSTHWPKMCCVLPIHREMLCVRAVRKTDKLRELKNW